LETKLESESYEPLIGFLQGVHQVSNQFSHNPDISFFTRIPIEKLFGMILILMLYIAVLLFWSTSKYLWDIQCTKQCQWSLLKSQIAFNNFALNLYWFMHGIEFCCICCVILINSLASARFHGFSKKTPKRTWFCVGISPVRYTLQTW